MSFQFFLTTLFKTVSRVASTSKWFVPEHFILATLFLAIACLSIETLASHQYNAEPIALMAKAKAQTTVVVAQAMPIVNQK